MRNKKGDYKYGIILSLILGVMVLSLSLYFIFQELWSDDELDWEICRQSIQIRALLPEPGKFGFKVSFKDDYPLKCKTQIVNIEKSDVKNIKDAQKIIAETMARCWALYDKGDLNAFPSDIYGLSSICVPCARIHLTEDAKEYLKEKKRTGINIRNSLMNLKMTKDYSYYEYLNNSGKKFPAFNIASSRGFDLSGDNFDIDKSGKFPAIFKNKLTGGVEDGTFIKSVWNNVDISRVSLPMIFNLEDGDLLINYGVITSSKKGGAGDYLPYLFYFQTNQKNPNPFNEVNVRLVDGQFLKNVGFCEQWEGIPA